jgi:hypothetical protein
MGEAIKEVELLSRAIEGLRNMVVGISVITTELKPTSRDSGHDALLRISFGDVRAEYAAIIKRYITNETIGGLASQLRRTQPQGILVTHHVTPNQAEKLKQLNVQFFDTAGNAFLNDPPLYVFVSGKRRDHEKHKDKPSRAFMPSGLRTIFALLCKPGLELQGYRDIAAAAKVSHGTIGWVMRDLEKERYLIDMGTRGRRLTKKADLVKRWTEAYPQQLRPKLLLARYSSRDPDWWKEARLEDSDAYWGGEVAAAKLTQYLRPQQKTIYAATTIPEIQAKYALKKDPNGDVEILKRFWAFDEESAKSGIAPPLLVYADLIASGDDRNIETAEIIYDTQISRLLGETPTV